MANLLQIRNLKVAYDQKTVLEKVNIDIDNLDFIGVIGPNGGGKTTLIKAILGLVPTVSGEIRFSDMLPNRGSDIGYLSQVNKFDNKFPISVFDVISSGLTVSSRLFHRFSTADKKTVQNIIDEIGIGYIAHKAIGELSGGQMQRVFLARALVSNPKLLILDEPDTYVDNRFEQELYSKLRELNKRMAILLVSHDLGTITTHVKSIACVNRTLDYHRSNIISPELLKSYNCPIQIITHGDVPHTVLHTHQHDH